MFERGERMGEWRSELVNERRERKDSLDSGGREGGRGVGEEGGRGGERQKVGDELIKRTFPKISVKLICVQVLNILAKNLVQHRDHQLFKHGGHSRWLVCRSRADQLFNPSRSPYWPIRMAAC